jgi:hypothetical protein
MLFGVTTTVSTELLLCMSGWCTTLGEELTYLWHPFGREANEVE